MPVLALGGDIYPGLGGDIPGNFTLAVTIIGYRCKGSHGPILGHWIPEERPDSWTWNQLFKFLEIV